MTTIRNAGPLLILLACNTLVFTVLSYIDAAAEARTFDPITTGVICFAYAFAAGVTLSRTRTGPWSILGAGLLATMLGDALLYYVIFAGTQDWTIPQPDAVLSLIRALLVCGAPFVVVGLVVEGVVDWRADREPSHE